MMFVLPCVSGGATGFAIGGYRYLQMPQEPAFNTIKLKANRLLNTSGELIGSEWRMFQLFQNLQETRSCCALLAVGIGASFLSIVLSNMQQKQMRIFRPGQDC